eukprot:GFUD01025799.1.p1 GENE.GFUD01025799.1~~GFUD01025799.1.p1  ORF type:complete len:234 (+),score=85.57 GFUD01025799.1:49-750(+)
MARKDNSKAKEKKMERKLMEMKMNAGWSAVKKANDQENPLAALPSFSAFKKADLNLSMETKRVTDLDEKTKDWLFQLLETNMKDYYYQAEWGWNSDNKKAELLEDTAWYLIAREVETGEPVAYCHFRFDMDHDDDVLYCYEIQTEQKLQRKGLGKFMMKVLELIMIKADLLKIMLTVFKHNEPASKFFKDVLKYEIDETCPYDTVYEQFDYEILSRVNLREQKRREQKEEPDN